MDNRKTVLYIAGLYKRKSQGKSLTFRSKAKTRMSIGAILHIITSRSGV